jgi:tRNA (guanine37-N1)-methyltransferase
MFRPPIVRSASAILDRALFSKTYPIAAARIPDKKLISKSRGMLEKSKDLLRLERVTSVREDPDPELAKAGAKCLLLKPEVKADGENIRTHSMISRLFFSDPATWSSILKQAVEAKELSLLPYELTLDYNYWTYRTYVGEKL